jgi:hypothetical protein
MSTTTLPFQPPRAISRKVAQMRLAVRLYVLLEGLAALVIVAGLAFWLGLAVDWKFEPSPAWRIVMWIAMAAAASVVAWLYILRRVFSVLRSDSLALLVERKHPQLGESFVTTVQAAGAGGAAPAQRHMLDASARRAEEALPGVSLSRVFDYRPLASKALVATALVASVVAFAAVQREAFGFWVERMRLSPDPWPRLVQLTVVGFEDGDGEQVVNVARDDAFNLNVLASIVDGHQAPAEVEVRWRLPDGRHGREPMRRIGEAIPGRDEAQLYRFEFAVTTDLEFDVIGGDDRVRNLRLHPVERPAVKSLSIDCEYPEYLALPKRTLPVSSGRAELPEGATAVCRAETNKPLVEVRVHDPAEQVDLPARVYSGNRASFSFELGRIAADRVLLVTLRDADGVENREPYRLIVSAVRDLAPEVNVQLRGIGTAVTPQARIPLLGQFTDDYGLVEAWFEYVVNEGAGERRSLRTQPVGETRLRMTEPFDLAEANPDTARPRVELSPGQTLVLSVQARDAYDLGDAPQVGASPRFHLDVVTASELRALLERRELGLRQRFEAIYEKMVGVRDLIDRIDLAAPAGEADDTSEPESPAELRARDLARLGGSRQNALQLAAETTGVADGFDDILAELVNNRVDTEELKQRLEQSISEPLKEIGGELLPALEERLAALQTLLAANSTEAAQPLAAAQAEAQAIVDAMQAVLDRMLELESYNELVELLRGIVSDQAELRAETLRQQRAERRELFEE